MATIEIPEELQHRLDPLVVDEEVAKAKGKLLNDIKRSVYVYRVDCGGCNACEIEIFASITPVFDVERFGIKVVPTPRHADILVYTGAVTRAMRLPALRAYEAAPDPKIVVSYGACGCTGGIFHDNYCVWGGTDKLLPVDVYIPGCPPTPGQTVYGFAMALGMLAQKQHATHHVEAEGESAPLAFPDIPYNLRVALEREARRMSGYRYGRDLVDEFMGAIEHSDNVFASLDDLIASQADPRRAEVYGELKGILSAKTIGGGHGCERGSESHILSTDG